MRVAPPMVDAEGPKCMGKLKMGLATASPGRIVGLSSSFERSRRDRFNELLNSKIRRWKLEIKIPQVSYVF